VSDVVESPFGFHIIRVEEKRAAGTKSLDAARDEIVAG
jgi:parvulin-like peptidyl-prolyl isomerase